MKFFSILIVYLKRTLRDKMFVIIMIIFPIALIWLLGNAFSGMIGDTGPQKIHANILYSIEDNSRMSIDFKSQMIDGEYDEFTFALEDDYDLAISHLKQNNYDAYVIVSDKNIKIYKNDLYNFNGAMAEMILSSFVDQYNIINEVIKVEPQLMEEILSNSNEKYTKVMSLKKEREPGSMDYYGVTITSMFIFYGLSFISTYIIGDKRQKTRDRILISPVSDVTYQWGLIAGNVIMLILQVLLLIFVSSVVFNTYWGDNLFMPILIFISELIMISALGAVIGITIKSEAVVSGIAQIIIPVLVFLGDGYVKIEATGIFGTIKKLSPIYWVNHSIFQVIYLNEYSEAYKAITICLSIALVCTLIILFIGKKRRISNG